MRKPERTEQGRRLAESLRQAAKIAEGDERHEIREAPNPLPEENQGFTDGITAERHLREHICPAGGINPLGPYIPSPERGITLGGRDELVRFPPHLQILFAEMSPDMARFLSNWLKAAVARQTVGRWWKRTWKIGVGIIVATFAAARWGVEQVPFLKELSEIFRGHGL